MRDLKHLYYFENLLLEDNNELVQRQQAAGSIAIGSVCAQIPEPLLNLPGCFAVRLRAPRTGSMAGYHGLFESETKKRGIHLIWVTHDLMVPEEASRKDMRTQVNRYMRTIMREEPLDESLEDFDDSLSCITARSMVMFHQQNQR